MIHLDLMAVALSSVLPLAGQPGSGEAERIVSALIDRAERNEADGASAGPELSFEDNEIASYLYLQDVLSDYLSTHAVSELSFVAYHKVAALLCAGVSVDTDRIAERLASVRPVNFADFNEEESRHWQDAALVNFGMIFGVMLAEHTGEEDEFCAEVEAAIQDPEAAWHLFDTDAFKEQNTAGLSEE